MTTSPDGERSTCTRRLAEIHDRYGSGHLVSRSIRRATPQILQAVDHVNASKHLTTAGTDSRSSPQIR